MSIIQISRIQQRAGNLVDLPQLDNAQLGWATDARRLFIGRVSAPYVDENVEVITSYSNISFSQVVGSYGTNLSLTNAENGQILGIETIGSDNYVVNKGGNAAGLVTLGTVSNVKITGGAIGYVLETDGTGNLNWTPKGYVIASIQALSNVTPIIMSVANTTPFTNGTDVTITGVAGANANTIVNSQVFYVKVANDYPTSGNVELYTNAGLTVPAVGTNLTATPNTGTATFLISSSGGTASAGGSQGSVQFNNSGVIDGSSNLVLSGANLDLVGTFTAANIFANAGTITSGNLTITNRISAGGNITGGNLIGIFANGTSSIRIPTVNGNINMGAAGNTTVVVVTGTGANINGTLSASGNIIGANLTTDGVLSATGIANNYIASKLGIGTTSPAVALHVKQNGGSINVEGTDQSYIQFYPRGAANRYAWLGFGSAGTNNFTIRNDANGRLILESGNSNVAVYANGNVTTTVAGVGNVVVVTSTGANIAGTLSTSGLISATGNITGANILTNGSISATGTLTSGNVLTGGSISGGTLSVSGTTTLTGVATAPTAANGTNNTQIATTAFVIYNGVPSGCIMLWSGSIASIPSGWYLCNGTNGTPNLIDRFVVAAGSNYPVGATGGNADAIVVSHSHTASAGGQSVNHSHSGTTSSMNRNNPHSHTGPLNSEFGTTPNIADGGSSFDGQYYTTGSTDINHEHAFTTGGVSADHNHAITVNSTGSSGTNANMPPYYALAYIMKA
jgi:hypothetical protein